MLLPVFAFWSHTTTKLISLEIKPLWVSTCPGCTNRLTFLYQTDFQLLSSSGNGWMEEKTNSPASFCRSRYAPLLRRPLRQAGNGGLKVGFFSFYSSDDVSFDVHHCNEGRAAHVELHSPVGPNG
ncbi:hypothetical protein CHARACLAT_026313 [Characodon lateralis]|uniref:Secreted protein n=1 Tax=Characodon lateralis TaxID=208331 RepID=A0ABU7E7T3_9TELE|nr:hypothetical protein [Characodon lateralis]